MILLCGQSAGATTATTTVEAKKKTHLNLPPLIKRDLILKEIQNAGLDHLFADAQKKKQK